MYFIAHDPSSSVGQINQLISPPIYITQLCFERWGVELNKHDNLYTYDSLLWQKLT